MGKRQGTWAGRLGAISIVAACAVPSSASADPPTTVRLGELEVARAAGVRGDTVRDYVQYELGLLDAGALRGAKRPLVLSVAVRLDGATCNVNATLRDARRGTMLAILQGSASSPAAARTPSVRDAIVRVAVRGAVRQIPDAIRAR
ncbi:MAG: hypothetical protein KC657_15950 [Myxococcales bacterium]|nr:hypothetical protein [Myxococcales bacterium]